MNVLLLGNGFDIHYKLPTQYANFLNVVNFLMKSSSTKFETIGNVFSNAELQRKDSFIKECYEYHKESYDKVLIDNDKINEIINSAKDNLWFNFLSKSLDDKINWIDFEKEITIVISAFESALSTQFIFKSSKGRIVLQLHKQNKGVQYIINSFNFFIDVYESHNYSSSESRVVKKEYCIEHPTYSGNITIDKEKIINYLVNELRDFEEILKKYLHCFVESSFESLCKSGNCKQIDIFTKIDKTITFNYTNTFEKIYSKNSLFHIHGNVKNRIILGVNSNESDNLEKIDTSFISFKKYFQRAMLETDNNYIQWLKDIVDSKTEYRLITMGHSLDETDKDIIENVFTYANEIVVLYHNDVAKMSYIRNLVKIFGKDGFNSLRNRLTFLSTNTDFSEYIEKIEKEKYDSLIKTLSY